jgi:acyl-CoA thioesterase
MRRWGITPLASDICQITRHFAGASSGETERAIHFHTRVVPLADWLLLETKSPSAERAP